ncbi:hypothetical protein Y032_0018g3626 [Ancylostoma ceylanicum]|uniref:Uncharacterized protein n=1 Tax=Ancylostoma ceylanicum TaxID=53326 RepID=A0A016V5F0_9BILA|nr:hypothetical protein Y032_0018g3626 [Ancylostoma ceylanicum]
MFFFFSSISRTAKIQRQSTMKAIVVCLTLVYLVEALTWTYECPKITTIQREWVKMSAFGKEFHGVMSRS